MLDTIKIAETPEGVELKLTCVSFYARSIAWLLDMLIQGVIMLFFLFVLPKLGDFGMGLLLIVIFLLHWLYPVFFEIFYQGQTPGKKAMNIQVLLMDGTMVNWGASLLRNLMRSVDFLPFMYVLGLVSMLINKDFRRLGDLVANTIVVYKRELKEKTIIAEVNPHAPEVTLSAREQQIIINYAERQNDFSPERAEELAALAVPLMNDLPVESHQPIKNHQQKNRHQLINNQNNAASQRLLGIANYLMGRR